MTGVEVFEEVDVARSARVGRLVLLRRFGTDYDAAALTLLAAALTLVGDLTWYRSGRAGLLSTALFLPVPLVLLFVGFQLVKSTARNRELVRIDGAPDSETTRAAFTRIAEEMGWEMNRNNADFGRYFFGRYVVTILFRRDHILLNFRRRYLSRIRWPIGLKERDEVVRVLSRPWTARCGRLTPR